MVVNLAKNRNVTLESLIPFILFREPTLKIFAQNGSIPQQRQQHAHIQNQTQPSLEVVEVTVDQTLESHPEQGRTAGPDISPH